MHSLSAMTNTRNKKLDPIQYIPKETNYRFFGIPTRLNLMMFRIIISTLSTSSYLISADGLRGYFTHIFVDEAGQATEADTWIPIGGLASPGTSLILAGDPKQLGPVVKLNVSSSFGYSQSMLKRLMDTEAYYAADDRSYVQLQNTYRSHFNILRPSSYLFYDNMLVGNDEDETLHRLCGWEGLPTKDFPIIFHSSIGSKECQGHGFSYFNEFEIEKVSEYVERIINETGTEESDIGIISPYKCQVFKLRQKLKARPRLTIDSVEGFQGSERDVIIISTVRTESLGFLRCDLRLNTTISRAKSLLVVIGNDDLLRGHESWRKFIYYCKYHGGYLDSKGTKLAAKKEEDIPIDEINEAIVVSQS